MVIMTEASQHTSNKDEMNCPTIKRKSVNEIFVYEQLSIPRVNVQGNSYSVILRNLCFSTHLKYRENVILKSNLSVKVEVTF